MSFNFYRLFGSDFINLNAQLVASESKGDVKVVSSPRILTLDNKKAKIKQGLEYAYLERDDSGGSSVKFKNIDLLLEVRQELRAQKLWALSDQIRDQLADLNVIIEDSREGTTWRWK